MIKKLNLILKKIGVDQAIIYVVIARILQSLSGIISIYFIAKNLTKVEQGYYFTFGSILAIQMFFELGLSNIITQFVAHEKAFLNWKSEIKLFGDEKSLSRLASLLQFSIKWFFVIGIILIIVLFFCGYIFFNKYGQNDSSVEWLFPWLILTILTAVNLMISPVFAFLEGLGKVKEVAKIRLIQQVIQTFSLLAFLSIGLKLYSSPLAAAFAAIFPIILILYSTNYKLLKNIWEELRLWKVDYKLEIFPYQWRIALSWMSGYFIFQLLNPVAFATDGAKAAGQLGMTLAILNGILAISLSWINTKVPLFSDYIAKREFDKLNYIFNKTILQSSSLCLFCLIVLNLIILFLKLHNFIIGDRFLSTFLLLFLSLATLVNLIVSALGTYLRCHKKEPFLKVSVIGGFLGGTSTIVFGKLFGVYGIVIGYSLLTVLSSFWSYLIFQKKRDEWHA